jgi:hypothetical protein
VNRKIFIYDEAWLSLLRKQIKAFRTSLQNLDFPEINTFLD